TLTLCGELGVSAALEALEAGVDGVGDEPGPEAAAGAHAPGRAGGDVQILGYHEFDAPDVDVPAGGEVVGGDGQGFQAPGVLLAAVVHLGEDGGQGHPLAGADV